MVYKKIKCNKLQKNWLIQEALAREITVYILFLMNTVFFRYIPVAYVENPSAEIVNEDIRTVYTFPKSTLDFYVHMYHTNGSYIGFSNTRNGLVQFCPNTVDFLNEAYQFGTEYRQEVNIRIFTAFYYIFS